MARPWLDRWFPWDLPLAVEDLNFDASDDDADVAWQLVALPMFVLVDVEASDFAAEAFEVGLQLEVVVVENETEVELLAW